MKYLTVIFCLLLWVIFALLDPDPDSEYGSGFTDLIDPDPIRIRIQHFRLNTDPSPGFNKLFFYQKLQFTFP